MNDVVLVTGAAGGIGRALCARLMAQEGELFLVDRDAVALQALARQLGPQAHAVVTDLTEVAQLDALIAEVRSRAGRLDVLINNAAIVEVGPFASRSLERIADEVRINLLAPLMLTRLALPLLQASAKPRIINTVSVAGVFPTPDSAVYCATKFGLRGAMLSLALELEPLGIQVCNILPSATDTRMLRHEAVSGGNRLQFMDPPQPPEAVVDQILRMMANPCLERAPKPSELWLTKLAMLFPNWLPRLLPLFTRSGERGLQRYLRSLEAQGLATCRDGRWVLTEKDHG